MKTLFLHTNLFLRTIYVLLFLTGTAYNGFSQATPRLTSVNPEANLATVTITNFGTVAIDMSKYWLCLRPGTYRQLETLSSDGSLNLMPSGSVTVSYNVAVGVSNDGLSLYLPDTTTNGGFSEATNLIDFVQWGAAGNIREPLAVAQGLWTEGDFISGSGPYNYIGNGTGNGLRFWKACEADGGEITGGPFNFTVDGSPDFVSGVSVSGSSGSNASWVITDDQGTILGLPPTVAALEGVDFDGAGVGTCLIWYIRYEDGLEGLSPGNNALTDLSGCYDLSNSIAVVRNEQVDGGEITGGPFVFCVDGQADNVSDISLSGAIGNNSTWVITDDQGLILGIPPTIAAVEGVDFDGAGGGVCLIWHLSYADGLEGLEPGNNALTDLSGTFDLSNSISVTRNAPNGGEITGGPFNFTVDGSPDFVSGVSVSGSSGSNASWVITDDQGTILGLPPTVAALEGVDFDGAGVGTCLIWYIRYEDGLEGLSPGNNALTDLSGCYDLSNSIAVVRNEQVDGGEITGGPFVFCVDGQADNVSDISLSGAIGNNSTWVITDDQGLILGIPPTIAAVEGVDFDGAGGGVCLIWHLSYADGLEGLEPGNNALTDLSGTFDLSNSISVTRNAPNGGEITGGPFNFIVDGSPDFVSGVSVSGSSGSNASWVITDDQGTILGLPPTVAALEGVDFDGAGVGTCLIWYIRYEDGLEGLSPGNNALTDLSGCYDLSNSIAVVRNEQIELNVVVFPIPASRFVNVILRGVINSSPEIQLFDLSGNPVDIQTFQRRNFIRINISNLQPGMYLLSVRDNLTGASTTRQIVVGGRF